jgi:DNA-binding LacI/PurR family transcriptional regulator
LVCPEDNVALILAAEMRQSGIASPERVGLLSVMGTDYATKAGISCLRYDYRAMGKLAVEALAGNEPVKHVLEAQLSTGTTT